MRVITAKASAAMPAPAATAMARSRRRRAVVIASGPRAPGTSKRFGSQRRPSSSRTVVTTSTSELRQGEVGRREPDEGDAGDQPGAAEQDQRREPVELGLPGGAERAGRADRPDQRKHGIDARGRQVARPEPAQVDGAGRRQDRHAHHQPQLRLQAAGAEQALQRSRETPGQEDHGPLEDAPAFQPADQRRALDRPCSRCRWSAR